LRVVTIHQAKTNLSRLIREASEGEEIVIARGSKPVARLVPVGEVKGKRRAGSLEGSLRVGPEFFERLPKHELDAWGAGSACATRHALASIRGCRRAGGGAACA